MQQEKRAPPHAAAADDAVPESTALQPPRCNSRKRGNDNAYIAPPPRTKVEGVSKSVAKQLWRQEMWKAKKKAKKAAKKAARMGAVSELPPTLQGRVEDPALQQQRREHRLAQRRALQEDFVRRCGEGARVVIDCGFDDRMTEKELKSLGQQLMYVYASNKRAPSPCFVHLAEYVHVRGSECDKRSDIPIFFPPSPARPCSL